MMVFDVHGPGPPYQLKGSCTLDPSQCVISSALWLSGSFMKTFGISVSKMSVLPNEDTSKLTAHAWKKSSVSLLRCAWLSGKAGKECWSLGRSASLCEPGSDHDVAAMVTSLTKLQPSPMINTLVVTAGCVSVFEDYPIFGSSALRSWRFLVLSIFLQNGSLALSYNFISTPFRWTSTRN